MRNPTREPVIGSVKFSIKVEGNWVQFGDFYYYDQITVNTLTPHNGPAEGRGIIHFFGTGFRDDFTGAELGCKVGESIGSATMVNEGEIRCTVKDIELVPEDAVHHATVALNSYSWPKPASDEVAEALTFIPYGVTGIYPNSGPYSGFTEVLVQGKGFTPEIAEFAQCRFGVDANQVVVKAEVLDYTKLMCRTPENFPLPQGADS